MKRIGVVLGIALSMCLLLGGCGVDKSKHLEVFSNKMENKDTLQKFVDAYMKEHPDVTIELQSPPDAGTVLRTKLTKNRIPDVMFLGGDAVYKDLADSGIFMDVSDMEEVATVKDAYKQQVYRLNRDQREVMYGIPYATNAEGMIYNVDIFTEYGIAIPQTYTELIAVCKTLQENEVQPFYFAFKDSWTIGPFFMPLAANIMPENFLQDRLADKTTFAETHQEVAEKILELCQYGQKDLLGKGYDDGNIAFANGKAAMLPQGNWAISNIRKSNPKVNLGMFAFPATENYEQNAIVSGIDVMATISATCKKEELAKDFVSFVFEQENIELYMKEQFAFSAVEGMVQGDVSVKDLQEKFAADNIVGFPDHFYPTGFDFSVDAQEFIGRGKGIEAFLQKMDENYNKYNVKE